MQAYNQRDSPIVFLAHGHGERLQSVTLGRSKAMLEIAGQTIIARLLREAVQSGRRVVVYGKPTDGELRESILEAFPDVTVKHRNPDGYFQDIVGIYGETGSEFTVVDADIVVPIGEVEFFLIAARRSESSLVIGSTLGREVLSESTNSRALRVSARDDGTVSLESDANSPRAVGLYHWREPALAYAKAFLRANEGARFRHFIRHLSEIRLPVCIVPISASFNVNTPEDLERARSEVRRW